MMRHAAADRLDRTCTRDRVAQALTFLLPIVFFSIFATVFGGQGDVSTARIRIAVVDEDHTEAQPRDWSTG